MTINEADGLLTIDGVTFSLAALAEFLRHIPEGGKVGPVMLERRSGVLLVTNVDMADVVLLRRRPTTQTGVTH